MTRDLFTAAPLPIAPLGHDERVACLRLIRSEHVGPVAFRELINHYGGAQRALDAVPELARRGGRRAIRLCTQDDAERELAMAEAIGAAPLFTVEPGYPKPLAWLDQPPPVIYVKGHTDLFEKPAIAIVGSRRSSAAGQAMARSLAGALGEAGFVVVSGLARGIDGVAHLASLQHGTVAVLAGGIDNIYPPEHADLHREIAAHGCLVSERPPGFKPRGQDFPRRNRIISGLALGVIVVEAAKRSGSLITARMAGEQGREVFAVPGHPLDPRAEGTNELIKAGARMITGAADVIAELSPQLTPPPTAAAPRPDGLGASDLPDERGGVPVHNAASPRHMADRSQPPPLPDAIPDDDRAAVVAALGPTPVALDDLVRTTGLTAQAVKIALLEISLAGRLVHHGRNMVSLTQPDWPEA